MLKYISKGIHGLIHTMLNSVDRQNVNSAKSLCNSKVIIAIIEYVKNSNGTVMFLKIFDNIYTRNTSCMTDNHRNFDLPTKEEMIEAIKESRAAALTDCIKWSN